MPISATRACGTAFLTAFVTLFTQVLVYRIVSAKLLNNYAFVVISLTMLGFAASGVLLSRWLPGVLARLGETISTGAAAFVVTLLATTALFYHVDLFQAPGSRLEFVTSFLRTVPYALLFAVPFAACGFLLGALLSSPTLPTRRVYFFDLVGSALGAFAVVPAIGSLGAEDSLLLGCAALMAGTLVMAPPRTPLALGATAAAVALLATCALLTDRVFDLQQGGGGLPPPSGGYGVEEVVWDPVARVEVWRIPPPSEDSVAYPSLIGGDARLHARLKRMITQNGYAFTLAADYDGRRESLAGIGETIYAAAYQARSVPPPEVGIIGVGGGFDVLTALDAGAARITGVEINAATVSVLTRRYRDYFRAWVEDPRVNLVLAEGRHHLAVTPTAYDVLQVSGVDSYSGTLAAAHVFSESYLYTAEAFDLFLSRLTPDGILNMMRLEYQPPREMLRALVTAVAALRRAGAERPAAHVVTITATPVPNFTALLVKKTPFAPEELVRLRAWSGRSPHFEVSAAPDSEGAPRNAYALFLAQGDPARERAFVDAYPWDVAPVSDDRPFFFRHSRWSHVFARDPLVTRTSAPVMEDSVLILLAITTAAALLCVSLPLRILTRWSGARLPARSYGLFFAAIGLGYLAVEVALLQRYGLFLGHPNYALSMVLACLLLFSGLGSLWSATLVRLVGGRLRFLSYALAALVIVEALLVLPHLIRLIGLPFVVRVAVVALLVAPIGLCMGAFLPTGLDRLKTDDPRFVPWAWGVNGVFSVIAPILGVAFSMTWGMEALLLAAVPLYLVSGFVLPREEVAGSGLELTA